MNRREPQDPFATSRKEPILGADTVMCGGFPSAFLNLGNLLGYIEVADNQPYCDFPQKQVY